MRMPFGKHAGKHLDEIPVTYLHWVIRACRSITPGLRRAIRRTLEERGCVLEEDERLPPSRRPPPAPAPDWAAVLRTWYRGLVMDYHPDRGGSREAMQAINEAHERLKRLLGIA